MPTRRQQASSHGGSYGLGSRGRAPVAAKSAGPAAQRRRRGRAPRARTRNSDFVEFLHRVLDWAFLPITYPLFLLRSLLTAPLTISVAVKAVLLVVLIAASAVVSIAAVGAFWWSWGTGGNVELEGWLTYGSRAHRMPHSLLQVAPERFQEDLPYDVQVELELVRPSLPAEELGGNFMVTLDLRSIRAPEINIIHAAQPSLPPPPLPNSLFLLPVFPTWMIPPCIIPWPLRALCPGRLLGYSGNPSAKIKERRRKGTLVSPARGNQVVVLTKELVEGIVINPGRGDAVGSAFVSIGREDSSPGDNGRNYGEVRTTGWVVVRFIPHPTGLRWLLTANLIPPLILLPPVSLGLTLTSALIGFIVITYLGRRSKAKAGKADKSKSLEADKSLAGKDGSDQDAKSVSRDNIDPVRGDGDDDDPPEPGFTGLDRGLFEREALDDVLLEHGRAWAAIERRRQLEANSPARGPEARTTPGAAVGATARATSSGATESSTTTSGTATGTLTGSASGTATPATESATATEETWDESESWESSSQATRT